MIREGRKLPKDVLAKVPKLVSKISQDPDIAALYAFGSSVEGGLRPLSDLDFDLLLSNTLSRPERSEKLLDLFGVFNDVLCTDEVDLVLLNNTPPRFAHSTLKTGELLYASDKAQIIDFFEMTTRHYLDFRFVRDAFDRVFLDGIGYRG